jgi:Tfp pilus assembly protein PilN
VRAVNLIPADHARKRRSVGTFAQLAVVSPIVVAAALAGGYFVTKSQVEDRRGTLRVLQDELARLPKPAAESPANAALAAQRDQRVRALAAALQGRIAWDRILREVSSVLPEDIWLTTLQANTTPIAPAPAPAAPVAGSDTTTSESTTTTTTPAPAPATPASGTALVLNGYTYSQEGVARFMSRLQVIPELADIVLERSELTQLDGRDVVKFAIDANVRAEAE